MIDMTDLFSTSPSSAASGKSPGLTQFISFHLRQMEALAFFQKSFFLFSKLIKKQELRHS